MQFDSMMEVFDSTRFTAEHPLTPEGVLFNYYPQEKPDALHYHDFLEIGYCEYGTGLFYIDRDIYPFSSPCCAIIYGGQIHIAQSINAEKSLWHFLYVDLPKLFAGEEQLLASMKAITPQLFDFPSLIPRDTDPDLYGLCVAIMGEAAEMGEDYLVAIRGLVSALLVRHSRHMTPASHARGNQGKLLLRLGQVMTYIGRNYMENITVEQLTKVAGMSKSTLLRDMTALTGMAPAQYIHRLRMKRAAALLVSRSGTIAEIAYDVGYGSLSSFNRHFHQEFGMPPTEWRKQQP